MKAGKTAMAFAWDDVIVSTLKGPNGFDPRFGFSTIPGDRSFIGGGAFFVSKQSKHPKEAMDFIIYLMQPKNQVKLARNGLSSPLISTYSDSIVASYPHAKALKESMLRGGIYPEAGPDSKMIDEVLSNYIQKTWSRDLSPTTAIQSAADEIARKRANIFEAIKNK
jgi:ABC-type glycerol-3-phosphate transport system substrate-binding protein